MAEKQRVMIVDDDPSIAELISLYLMKECYDTLTVEDGELVVSTWRGEAFDPSTYDYDSY